MGQLQRVVLLLLLAGACIHVNAQSFPKMDEIYVELYQTEVTLTNEDQDFTAVATEYYDGPSGTSVLDLLVMGDRITYYYYNYTGDMLEVNGTACTASPADETVEYYEPPFYGWVNRKPFVIGPSALLWWAQNFKMEYKGTEVIRGIKCDSYVLDIDANDDKIDATYYFAVKEWTTPYKFPPLRVPIRIEITGASNRTTQGHLFKSENQIIDFTYFKTIIDDWTKMQPPYGLGCFGRNSDLKIPDLPQAFKYSAQIHDMLKDNESDAITYERVYFDNRTQMARLDTWSRQKRSSVVYDFGDGVSYNIEDRSKCSIKPIRKSMFVRDDGHLLSFVKSPQQILGLTGDFYFMGYRMYRGIPCSVFESAKRSVYYQGTYFNLLVATVFFTQDYTEVVIDAEDLMQAPVYMRVTGYNANKAYLKLQFNIFGFDDVSGESMMYRSFPIESCFPGTDQRNYFVLMANAGKDTDAFVKEIARPLEGNNYLFLSMVRSELSKALKISDLRVPFLKAEYLTTGVYVTGLLLDRPPALSQFWLMYKARVRLGKNLKLRELASTKEECAMTCIGEPDFICRGFHFCGQTCLTASESIDQDPVANDERHECEVYMRGLANSNNQQLYLPDIVMLLEDSVEKNGFTVDTPLENESISLRFSDVIFGEGPFTKNKPDNSFKLVVENSQLFPEEDRETTLDQADIDTLLDCYQTCKSSKSISCASFSLCPRAKNKQCRISSVLITDAAASSDEIDSANGCNVYSVLFLELFNKHSDLVPIIPGGKAFRKVASPEECARRCKAYGEFSCRGFEYCENKKTCVLHHRHALELSKEEFGIGNKTCNHYSAKYIADYIDMGKIVISDVSEQDQGKSVEECARACSEQMPSCKSFNYCPASEEGASDSVCGLSTKTISSNGVSTKDGGKCHLFTKRKDVEEEGWDHFKLDVKKETKSSNVAGVAIGTLVFGLVVGIAAAVGYSYCRSRRGDDGMAIRFMKS